MPQHSPIDRRASAFANASAQELAQLRKSLKAAQDGIAGLNRVARVPTPRGGRRTISGSRTSPNIFERAGISAVGGVIGRDTAGELGFNSASFSASFSQIGSAWSNLLQNAQRIT